MAQGAQRALQGQMLGKQRKKSFLSAEGRRAATRSSQKFVHCVHAVHEFLVPVWVLSCRERSCVIERQLIKSGDDWRTKADSDDPIERVASEDVSSMPDVELEKLLDSVNREINPNADEEEDEEDEE
jgi:hypothetical protein